MSKEVTWIQASSQDAELADVIAKIGASDKVIETGGCGCGCGDEIQPSANEHLG